MRRIATLTSLTVSTTAIALAFTAAPVVAEKPSPLNELKVSIGQSMLYPLSSSGRAVSVLLTCDPAGGTHPNAKAACGDIAAYRGDIAAIPPRVAACLANVDPVEISVTGIWQGKEISFREKAINPSCARISHGYVFSI